MGKSSFSEVISEKQATLTPAERRLADHFLRHYPRSLMENASTLARALDLHPSTVTRFFAKLGYPNFRAVRAAFRREAAFAANSPRERFRESRQAGPAADLRQAALEADLANLRDTFQRLAPEAVTRWRELLAPPAARVFVLGQRKAHSLAFYLYLQLTAIRPGVTLVTTEHNLQADQLTETAPGDLLMVVDLRRYARLNSQVARVFQQRGGRVILFTDSPLAPFYHAADLALVLSTRGVSLFDSYTAGMALINYLLAEYVAARGDVVSGKYERLEENYREFEVWSWPAVDPRRRPRAAPARPAPGEPVSPPASA